MLKITAPRLVKNLREDVDWMDCISRQEDDFTECSFMDYASRTYLNRTYPLIPAYSPIVVSLLAIIVNLSLAMWYLRTVTYQI